MMNANTYGEEKRQELVVEMYMKKLLASMEEVKQKIDHIDQRLGSLELKQNEAPIQPRNVPQMMDTPKFEEKVNIPVEEPIPYQQPVQNKVEEQPPYQEPVQNTPPESPSFSEARPEPVKQPAQTNQRTGGLTSEDVSIEKFFYAGNK